MKTEKSQID